MYGECLYGDIFGYWGGDFYFGNPSSAPARPTNDIKFTEAAESNPMVVGNAFTFKEQGVQEPSGSNYPGLYPEVKTELVAGAVNHFLYNKRLYGTTEYERTPNNFSFVTGQFSGGSSPTFDFSMSGLHGLGSENFNFPADRLSELSGVDTVPSVIYSPAISVAWIPLTELDVQHDQLPVRYADTFTHTQAEDTFSAAANPYIGVGAIVPELLTPTQPWDGTLHSFSFGSAYVEARIMPLSLVCVPSGDVTGNNGLLYSDRTAESSNSNTKSLVYGHEFTYAYPDGLYDGLNNISISYIDKNRVGYATSLSLGKVDCSSASPEHYVDYLIGMHNNRAIEDGNLAPAVQYDTAAKEEGISLAKLFVPLNIPQLDADQLTDFEYTFEQIRAGLCAPSGHRLLDFDIPYFDGDSHHEHLPGHNARVEQVWFKFYVSDMEINTIVSESLILALPGDHSQHEVLTTSIAPALATIDECRAPSFEHIIERAYVHAVSVSNDRGHLIPAANLYSPVCVNSEMGIYLVPGPESFNSMLPLSTGDHVLKPAIYFDGIEGIFGRAMLWEYPVGTRPELELHTTSVDTGRYDFFDNSGLTPLYAIEAPKVGTWVEDKLTPIVSPAAPTVDLLLSSGTGFSYMYNSAVTIDFWAIAQEMPHYDGSFNAHTVMIDSGPMACTHNFMWDGVLLVAVDAEDQGHRLIWDTLPRGFVDTVNVLVSTGKLGYDTCPILPADMLADCIHINLVLHAVWYEVVEIEYDYEPTDPRDIAFIF